MMQSDLYRVRRYRECRDAEAFAELVRRHAPMVFRTGLRITGDREDAEDVAQECFLALARDSAQIVSSPAGWLHAKATSTALKLLRSTARRRQHESAAASPTAEASRGEDEAGWEEVAPVVDAALAALSEDLRLPLVLHYLEGRSQAEVAEALGLSQSAVSRRLDKGVAALRRRLRRSRVAVSTAALTVLLGGRAAEAAVPASLTATLGKMALAGVGKATAVAASTVPVASTLGLGIVLSALVLGGVLLHRAATGGAADTQTDRSDPQEQPTMPTRPTRHSTTAPLDPTGLRIQGDGWHQDTFCLALVAAGRALGVESDYTTLCARSTHAFAPELDVVNDCKALLQCQGWLAGTIPEAMHDAAASVGLDLHRLQLPGYDGAPDDAAAKASHQARCRACVQTAMDHGQVVITTTGWHAPSRRFVEPWFAGVITRIDPDGQVHAAHPNGREERLAELLPGELYAVGRRSPPSLAELHPRLLRRAVDRIHARGAFISGRYHTFGISAMDEWIRLMRDETGFCRMCQEKKGTGWQDAETNGAALVDRASAAAAYLRDTEAFPESMRHHLEEAAACYERIGRLLRPALQGPADGRYRMIIGDLETQRRHAEQVLVPIREQLLAAAAAMHQALEAVDAQVSLPPPLPERTLHIVWDPVFAERIREAGIPGDTCVFRDPVAYGPAPEVPEEEWNRIRGRYWAASMPEFFTDEATAIEAVRRHGERLDACPTYEEVVLWADTCLFDMALVARHLADLSRRAMDETRLSIVLGSDRIRALAEHPLVVSATGGTGPLRDLDRSAMTIALAERIVVTPAHVSFGQAAWRALRSSDPRRIEDLLLEDRPVLPSLNAALRRHLQRFPSIDNGLGRLEQKAMELLAEGATSFREVMDRLPAIDHPPFYGEAYLAEVLHGLAACREPLLAIDGPEQEPTSWRIGLTPTGRQVLAGEADHVQLNDCDRWVGGVHLQGARATWRWDEEAGRLVQASGDDPDSW